MLRASTHLSVSGPHGGAAVCVHTDSFIISLQVNSQLQVVAVKVFLDKFCTLSNLYLPSRLPVTSSDLDDSACRLSTPFLLLGDFNGHHPLLDFNCLF